MNCEETYFIETLKVIFKVTFWLIFTYFSLLISSIEMLAKYFSMQLLDCE